MGTGDGVNVAICSSGCNMTECSSVSLPGKEFLLPTSEHEVNCQAIKSAHAKLEVGCSCCFDNFPRSFLIHPVSDVTGDMES